MKKSKITRTPEDIKRIKTFIKNHGFETMAAFSKAVDMDRQNVHCRIIGKTDPSIRMLLQWASILHCDITELITLFYPKEYAEYKEKSF